MYSASASCCTLISSSVSGKGIGVSCGFSTYAALLAAVTVGAASAAVPALRKSVQAKANDFFHVVMCDSPL